MRLVRINGELAEVVPTGASRAKLVYLAGEPKDRLPTEVQYLPLEVDDGLGRERLTLKSSDVLLVERVEPNLGDAFNLRHRVRELLAKLLLKRPHGADRSRQPRSPSRWGRER